MRKPLSTRSWPRWQMKRAGLAPPVGWLHVEGPARWRGLQRCGCWPGEPVTEPVYGLLLSLEWLLVMLLESPFAQETPSRCSLVGACRWGVFLEASWGRLGINWAVCAKCSTGLPMPHTKVQFLISRTPPTLMCMLPKSHVILVVFLTQSLPMLRKPLFCDWLSSSFVCLPFNSCWIRSPYVHSSDTRVWRISLTSPS